MGKENQNQRISRFHRKSATNRAATLDLMLGQIANFAPVISRNTIIKNSTSLKTIWDAIRLYYGIQSNGARFLDFVTIQSSPSKRHEALYQEMCSFIEESLLTRTVVLHIMRKRF